MLKKVNHSARNPISVFVDIDGRRQQADNAVAKRFSKNVLP